MFGQSVRQAGGSAAAAAVFSIFSQSTGRIAIDIWALAYAYDQEKYTGYSASTATHPEPHSGLSTGCCGDKYNSYPGHLSIVARTRG